MREKKFKVWEPATKTMWKETVSIQDICDFGIEAARCEWHAGNYEGECENPIEGCEFIESTGLLDKNGKEIYEGDIIKQYDEIVSVFFNESTATFDVLYLGGDCDTLCYENGWEPDYVEIIGNIYENPELIK